MKKTCRSAKGMHLLPCLRPEDCALAECEDDPSEIDQAQQIIESRESSHGDYRKQAAMAQALKCIVNDPAVRENSELSDAQRESLDMICVKISRILNGNPNEPDHWRDIAGYATLISNLLTKGTHL